MMLDRFVGGLRFNGFGRRIDVVWGDARRFSVLVPISSGSSVFGHVSFFVRRLGNGIGETQPSWPAELCVLQVTDIYIKNI